jgi:MFS family permease
LRTSALYIVVRAFGLGCLGIGVILLHTIPLLTDSGFTRSEAAALSSLMSLLAFGAKPFWVQLVDKLDPKLLSTVAFGLASIGTLLILIGANDESLPILIAGCALLGWSSGGFIPLQETIVGSYFGRRYLGRVRSVGPRHSRSFSALAGHRQRPTTSMSSGTTMAYSSPSPRFGLSVAP